MGGTVRIFTIRGIPINIHASWLVIYGLITWTLAVGYFPRALPDLPVAAYWANGLLAALLLFVSVLLHELSHSLVAMAHGLSVRDITLHVFGGVSHLEDEPPTPRAEFLIAVVGPITSFAIAAVLWVIAAAGLVHPAWARAVVAYLVLVNVAVGVFNLVPGFPLDGGRVLRAVLWKRSEEHTSELQSPVHLVALLSFPTRRSSDLDRGGGPDHELRHRGGAVGDRGRRSRPSRVGASGGCLPRAGERRGRGLQPRPRLPARRRARPSCRPLEEIGRAHV